MKTKCDSIWSIKSAISQLVFWKPTQYIQLKCVMLIPQRKIYCITFSCELCFKHYDQIKDDKYKPTFGTHFEHGVNRLDH